MDSAGVSVYEVVIQDRAARLMRALGRDAGWVDFHVRDISARDEAEARAIAAKRFPPEDGFVIEDVSPLAA